MPVRRPDLDEAGERARLRALRRQLVDELERMVDLLDALDGDPDLEDGADDEPSMGSHEGLRCGTLWGGTNSAPDEAEEEDEHGTELDHGEHDDADHEPSLCGLTVACATFASAHNSHGLDTEEGAR